MGYFGCVIADNSMGGDTGTQGGGKTFVYDEIQQSVINPHVIHMLRYPTNIKEDQTTTGLHQRAIVIKQGVLKQGQTYIAEVKVTRKGKHHFVIVVWLE